jgi:YesN/AraC family two-component response regulator
MELDMISGDDWSSFRERMQIFAPILLLTSAEATFEKARLAIDVQALDLMIKPFSTTKVKEALQKASRKVGVENDAQRIHYQSRFKDIAYESLFLSQPNETEDDLLAAFKTESPGTIGLLYSFLSEYPFKDLHGVFALSDMVVLIFKENCINITEQCQKAMRKWEEEFSEPLAIVAHKGKLPLHEKYLETKKMLEFTYYKGYRQLVEFQYQKDWNHIDPFLDPPEQRIWIDMLANFDLEKIKKWLYDEFLQLHDPYPDPGLIRIRLTSILAQIRRFMKTFNLNEEMAIEKEYRYIFNSILYDSVLYRTVQNLILFIQKIFQAAEASSKKFKQDPIERGISYMEGNFSKKNLRLEDVAQYVDRNPSYLSHLFFSKIGKGFTEVLVGIRMKEAKRLLFETNKPIKEIAVLVGYHNSNYFSKSFKEITGMSPREFRAHLQTQS